MKLLSFLAIALTCTTMSAIAEERQLDYTMNASLAGFQHKKWSSEPSEEPEPEKKYDYSIGFGGWSRHNTGDKPNRFKEQNPILEFDVWLDYEVMGGRPFIGYGHVFKNSRRGTADMLLAANQWKLIRGPYFDLCGGLGAMHIKYTDPNPKPGKPSSMRGTVPLAYLCLEKGPVSARFIPLGKDVLFMYFVYSF